MPLLYQWAYLAKQVVMVIHGVHSWRELFIVLPAPPQTQQLAQAPSDTTKTASRGKLPAQVQLDFSRS